MSGEQKRLRKQSVKTSQYFSLSDILLATVCVTLLWRMIYIDQITLCKGVTSLPMRVSRTT